MVVEKNAGSADVGKIGMGAYPMFGTGQMLQDIASIGAHWFYTWSASVADAALAGWILGDDVSTAGSEGEGALQLGSGDGSWAYQDIVIDGQRSVVLSAATAGSQSDTGGVQIQFRDSQGRETGLHWLELNGTSGSVSTDLLVVPQGTSSARVLAWGDQGSLGLNKLSVVDGNGQERLINPDLGAAAEMAAAATASAEFVPMVWGDADMNAETLASLRGAETVLTFNEPDHPDQANMSVERAISHWAELESLGARLSSPAVTDGGALGEDAWLTRFMERADALDLRVDFIAVHYYAPTHDVDAFRSFLDELHEAHDRPIWVTEWALVDWTDQGRYSLSESAAFFDEASVMLNELDYVERHSWFGLYDNLDNLDIDVHLVRQNGALTEVGEVFVDAVKTLSDPEGDDPASEVIAEYGTVRVDHRASTVTLEHDFDNPVLLATATSLFGGQEFAVRATQVDSNSFTIFLDEANYLDGWHAKESVSWMVVESGAWELSNGSQLVAGTVNASTLSSAGTTQVDYGVTLDASPIVLTMGQTAIGGDMLWSRSKTQDQNGFELVLEEEEALNGGQHLEETFGYLAMTEGRGMADGLDAGTRFETSTGAEVVNSSWSEIEFSSAFERSPVLLADVSSHNGGDPTELRMRDLSTAGVETYLQEDRSLDDERFHVDETVDWLALDGAGVLYGTEIDSGMWGA